MSRAPGPFERHLREAIALNRERAPRYASLSGGASLVVSWALIASEVMLLPVARWFDRRAEVYHRAGVPLLESMFVPMSGALPFLPTRPAAARAKDAPAPQPTAIRARVIAAYRASSFAGAAAALEHELAALADTPGTDCMLRHLLESAYRVAELAPNHIALAQERGLRSPAKLLAVLFRMHLWGLYAASLLDRRALPLQARGIAILAQDLPPIPSVHRYDRGS